MSDQRFPCFIHATYHIGADLPDRRCGLATQYVLLAGDGVDSGRITIPSLGASHGQGWRSGGGGGAGTLRQICDRAQQIFPRDRMRHPCFLFCLIVGFLP